MDIKNKTEDYIVYVKLEDDQDEIEAYAKRRRSPEYHQELMWRLNHGDYEAVVEEIPELAD